jgi:hypothetical protein
MSVLLERDTLPWMFILSIDHGCDAASAERGIFKGPLNIGRVLLADYVAEAGPGDEGPRIWHNCHENKRKQRRDTIQLFLYCVRCRMSAPTAKRPKHRYRVK